jgi:group II intron reverse transcriptase/maturase
MIPKREVWEAYKRVRANQGAAGIDGQTIADFEADLANNLYKLWNRLTSGSYFPPPVRRVDIPKSDGKMRPLGIPTVADRIAQMVVKRHLEPRVEPEFHPDSYGYRPGKSALDAISAARRRCWRYDWVVDLDIKAFFDSIEPDLLMRAVRKHTDCPWALLYIERWLGAPVQMPDGSLVVRERGTPQGGVISPLLANLFLHYAFDVWMRRNFPDIPFERYADDAICHCRTEDQATALRAALDARFADCGLTLHPDKTKIVFCRDESRRGTYPVFKFDFLGYNFRPRFVSKRAGGMGVSFTPAASPTALKAIRGTIRRWALHLRSSKALDDLARMFNSYIRGWINYYGRFCPSALYPTLWHIERYLARWASGKYKSLRGHKRRSRHWLLRIAQRQPRLFAHWPLIYGYGRTTGARVSRPVLRARGGAIPPRHSPACEVERKDGMSVARSRSGGRGAASRGGKADQSGVPDDLVKVA